MTKEERIQVLLDRFYGFVESEYPNQLPFFQKPDAILLSYNSTTSEVSLGPNPINFSDPSQMDIDLIGEIFLQFYQSEKKI